MRLHAYAYAAASTRKAGKARGVMFSPCVAVWLRGGARCDVAAVRRSVAARRRAV